MLAHLGLAERHELGLGAAQQDVAEEVEADEEVEEPHDRKPYLAEHAGEAERDEDLVAGRLALRERRDDAVDGRAGPARLAAEVVDRERGEAEEQVAAGARAGGVSRGRGMGAMKGAHGGPDSGSSTRRRIPQKLDPRDPVRN